MIDWGTRSSFLLHTKRCGNAIPVRNGEISINPLKNIIYYRKNKWNIPAWKSAFHQINKSTNLMEMYKYTKVKQSWLTLWLGWMNSELNSKYLELRLSSWFRTRVEFLNLYQLALVTMMMCSFVDTPVSLHI